MTERHVFISYASEDSATALKICSSLESAGVRCWIAPRNIPAGMEYAKGIIQGISDAGLLVLVFSTHAHNSEHVHTEVERAFSKKITIIPLRLQPILPTDAMEYYLSNPQWRDAWDGPIEKHLADLVADVKSRLAVEASGNRGPRPIRTLHRMMMSLGVSGMTLAVASMIGALAAWFFRATLMSGEKTLIAVAILGVLPAWLFSRSRRSLPLRVGILAFGIISWTYSFASLYRVPPFQDTEMGVLVARFHNDRNDEKQGEIFSGFQRTVELKEGRSKRIRLRKLPRRFSDRDEVVRLARQTNARIVIFGKVATRVEARIVINGLQGAYDAVATVQEPLSVLESDGFPVGDLEAVQKLLAKFLIGYNYYHSKDYPLAIRVFEDATVEEAKRLMTATKAGGVSPLEAALASTYFYLGNSHFLGQAEESIPKSKEAYEKAISYANGKYVLDYVEPLVNLSVLQSDEGADGLLKARDLLKDPLCRVPESVDILPCLYVEYNRALFEEYGPTPNYAETVSVLDRLIEMRWPRVFGAVSPNSAQNLLFAYAYRNRAFARTRLADQVSGQSSDGYEKAEADWNRAVTILNSEGLPVPHFFHITISRILIGQKKWAEAREALKRIATEENDPEVQAQFHLLSHVLEKCTKEDFTTKHLEEFMPLASPEAKSEGFAYLESIKNKCLPSKQGENK